MFLLSRGVFSTFPKEIFKAHFNDVQIQWVLSLFFKPNGFSS